jgi:hypothetical protein
MLRRSGSHGLVGRSMLALAAMVGLAFVGIAREGSARAAAPQSPVRSCASLTTIDLVDAEVTSAADSSVNGVLFCEVKGYLSPNDQFTALLPQSTWLGDYLQQGVRRLLRALGGQPRRPVADEPAPGAV